MDKTALREAADKYAVASPDSARALFRRAGRSPWIVLTKPDLGTDVRLRLGVTPEGVYACTGLAIGLEDDRTAIPASTLRIPVATIVEEVVEVLRAAHQMGARAAGKGHAEWLAVMAEFFDPQRLAKPIAHIRRGRTPLTDEHFREVARQYRAAERDPKYGRKPMVWLAEKWPEYAARTRKHWVAVAREKGYLAPWTSPNKRRTRRAAATRTKKGRTT
jgi:hypothetical protein